MGSLAQQLKAAREGATAPAQKPAGAPPAGAPDLSAYPKEIQDAFNLAVQNSAAAKAEVERYRAEQAQHESARQQQQLRDLVKDAVAKAPGADYFSVMGRISERETVLRSEEDVYALARSDAQSRKTRDGKLLRDLADKMKRGAKQVVAIPGTPPPAQDAPKTPPPLRSKEIKAKGVALLKEIEQEK